MLKACGEGKFDPPPPKNPLANSHKNLHTWLSWVCLPSCQILSRSDKGLFLHMRDFVHSCVLVIFFCFFWGGVLSITYSQDACNNFNAKYIKWCREKFHLVELNVLIKFHQNNQKVIYFRRFDLYQRPSSEEAGTRSSSGSWRDKLESSQESGRMYDWVGSSLRPGSWIVDLPSGCELPPWSIW